VERFISDLDLTKPKQQAAQQVHDHHPRWIPPPPGFAKINVDAALSKNSSSVSVAAVARDSSGRYLGASTMVFSGVSDPEIFEALACREGLALANDLLIRRAKVASDRLNAVRSIQTGGMGTHGHITQEIKATVEDFLKIEFVHERKESNTEAHNLARSAIYNSPGRHVWLVTPPVGVCNQYVLS
jgi:hypothetical protein